MTLFLADADQGEMGDVQFALFGGHLTAERGDRTRVRWHHRDIDTTQRHTLRAESLLGHTGEFSSCLARHREYCRAN